MKSGEALRKLVDITASQWGMVTTAQAGALGVTRLTLSRLAESGHLERLAHGVYRDAGSPSDEFEDLRAAWLSTEPKLLAEDRLGNLADGVVVASSSAAMLHGIGDLWANRHEFVTPRRRQTQRAEIHYRQRKLDDRDVTIVEGLPTMTLERTLADLLDDVGDTSLVADTLGAAVKKRWLDLDRLKELLAPLAERNGFKRHDGNAVLEHLFEAAGLDLESVACRISGDSALGSRVFINYLKHVVQSVERPNLDVLVPDLKSFTPAISDFVGEGFRDELRLQRKVGEIASKALADSAISEVSKAIAGLVNTPALANISQQWAKELSAFPAFTSAREAVPTDQEPDHNDTT